MAWFPKTIMFGRGGKIHLDGLRDFNSLAKRGQLNPSDLDLIGSQQHRHVRGRAAWVLVIVATSAILLAWLL